jgi:c-di-GMP-binding flagellar brake protein YcgR
MGLVPYCCQVFSGRNLQGKEARKQNHSIVRINQVTPQNTEQTDRRHSDRFPIEREVKYKVLNKRGGEEAGDGRTVNISSSGVLFTTEHVLLPGRRLEVAISWPAQLNNKTALKLVARGRVVRFEDGRAAIEILQYEFRTQAPQQAAGPRLVF